MRQAHVLLFQLIVFGLLFIAGCTKEKKIVEPVSTSIIGLASYSYGINVRFTTPSFESISFAGYDEARQISATFNNQSLRRRDNYNFVGLTGDYKVSFNQSYTFRITVDGKSGTYTDTLPDTLYITSPAYNAGVPANQPVLLQWNNPRNTDFFFVFASVTQLTAFFDSTFVTTDNQLTLPGKLFPAGTTTSIDVFAVTGLPARVTNNSNLQGNLDGRIYFYIRTSFFRLRGGGTAAEHITPMVANHDDVAAGKFREFIGLNE
jgi:hypothetical protein